VSVEGLRVNSKRPAMNARGTEEQAKIVRLPVRGASMPGSWNEELPEHDAGEIGNATSRRPGRRCA
jgi:hypothetical protein